MQIIYLAGPINGCTDEETHGWRNYVKSSLSGLYEFIDPTDNDYRGKERGHAAEIVQLDLANIARSWAVLWNRWKASDGSTMEMPYAKMLGKPAFVVSSEYELSPWVEYHTIARFPTVEVACGWFAEQKIGAKPTPIRSQTSQLSRAAHELFRKETGLSRDDWVLLTDDERQVWRNRIPAPVPTPDGAA